MFSLIVSNPMILQLQLHREFIIIEELNIQIDNGQFTYDCRNLTQYLCNGHLRTVKTWTTKPSTFLPPTQDQPGKANMLLQQSYSSFFPLFLFLIIFYN